MITKIRASVSVAALLAAALVAPAPAAFAWGKQGHDVVGGYADNHLGPEAKGVVARLLAGEANPTLAGVATWADDIRSNGSELGKTSAPWHFADIADNNCAYTSAAGGGQNVVEALRTQTAILADTTKPDSDRAQALKFVVHFVGDAHQPFHAGYESDRGGNDHPVTYNGTHTNMHSVWDTRLLATLKLSDVALVGRLEAMPDDQLPAPDVQNDPATWVEESCNIAIHAYPDSATIGAEYTDKYLPVAEQRLHLGGERLAQLLNAILVG
ncbi:MAG: S1/P1 nuclease [Segniliparus sp.]|uniref:S1/P1 nuclease n=1 Tax=Segniliparus sp. TaxID=2804064 RepID=UPI003F330174